MKKLMISYAIGGVIGAVIRTSLVKKGVVKSFWHPSKGDFSK